MNGERDAILMTLEAFDEAFASGDARAYASTFAPDGRLLLLYSDPIQGREAILEDSLATFATWDTSAWRTERQLVDACGDRAWALSTYSETLVHRVEGRRRVIRGRLLHVLRREPDGWRVEIAMNSHSRRVEELPAESG
jgi:uncharacterized protein (TIGR02246 family)